MKTPRVRRFVSASCGMLLLAAIAAASPRGALSLVPPDATTVGFVRLADLRSNPLQLKLLDETDRLTAEGDAGKFMREAGVNPREDVDTVVASMTAMEGHKGRALVVLEGRFDRDKLSAAVENRGGIRTSTKGGGYFRLKDSRGSSGEHDPGAVAFVDAHLVIAGSEPAVVAALADRASGGTRFASGAGLGRELHRIDPAATAWVLVDVDKARQLGADGRAQGAAASVVSALRSVSLVAMQASVDGDALALQATGLSSDEESRSLLEDALRGLTAAWRMAAQEKSPELVSAIRKFEIRRNDEGVTISGKLSGDLIRSLAAEAHRKAAP